MIKSYAFSPCRRDPRNAPVGFLPPLSRTCCTPESFKSTVSCTISYYFVDKC